MDDFGYFKVFILFKLGGLEVHSKLGVVCSNFTLPNYQVVAKILNFKNKLLSQSK